MNQAAKIIRKVKDSKCSITIKDVDNVKDWYIEVSTDASLRVPVSWFCNKISRVLDSTLAAECLSLKEGLHEAICVRQVNEELFGLNTSQCQCTELWTTKELWTQYIPQ